MEMVALPSKIDQWIKCQAHVHCAGHYMDDYYIIMPDVEQLKAVGITAEIQPVEWGAWLSEVYGNRQFQSTVVGVDASNMTARALLERFTSAADDNFINYQNTDYDALFQQAQATADDAEQTELYKQMERNLTEHAANVYIQDLADLVVLRNGLEGYQFYPIYVMDLSTVHYAQ